MSQGHIGQGQGKYELENQHIFCTWNN